MAVHPANAVFVSGDGKVSFNENGRKLDSLGNVVWGDRQSLRGARARVRPEIEEAYRQMDQPAQQPPAQQQPPSMPTYQPPAVAAQPPVQQPATSPWRNVSQWQNTSPQAQQTPAWEPPPSGLGFTRLQQNWNQFEPQRAQPSPFQMYVPTDWNQFRR